MNPLTETSADTGGSPDIAAVLFDMDGTLIDSEHLWLRAEVATVASIGGQWTEEDQHLCLGGPLERVAEHMALKSRTSVPVDEIGLRLLDEMETLLRTEPPEWRPGARALLEECREAGMPVALVSASHRRLLVAVAEAVSRDLGSEDVFDVSVAGDEVPESKPHPAPYVLAAQLLGVDIAFCVVIEDSPTGVESGQASGAYVVAVPHMVDIPPAVRRTVISTLEGVTLDRLRGWACEDRRPDRRG